MSKSSRLAGDVNAYLYYIGDLQHPVNIEKKLKSLIRDPKQRRVFTGTLATGLHIYAVKWIDSKHCQINIDGDFSLTYLWDLHDSLTLIKRSVAKKAFRMIDESKKVMRLVAMNHQTEFCGDNTSVIE